MISLKENSQRRLFPSLVGSPTILACVLGLGLVLGPFRVESQTRPAEWDRAAAADYLDGRQACWRTWPVAARDYDTACVSCHTVLPYALARPALRTALGEDGGWVNRCVNVSGGILPLLG